MPIMIKSIFWIMLVTAFFSFCLSLFQRRKILIPISILMFFSFGCDLLFTILYNHFNIYIYTGLFYRLVELLILVEFYYLLFLPHKSKRLYLLKTVIQLSLGAILFIVCDKNTTPIRLTNSILFSICAIAFFIQMIKKMVIEFPSNYPLFWINAAILIYFTGSLFIFLVFDPLAKLNPEVGGFSYILHNIMGIGKNILIAIGFWKAYKFPKWQSKTSIQIT